MVPRSHLPGRVLSVAIVFLGMMAALCAAPGVARAVVFNQSGNVVQITTVNELAAWNFNVYWSDTTETPIPSTRLLNGWSVPVGQTAYSVTLPELHRRYRFDVSSVRPTVSGVATTVPSWSSQSTSGVYSGGLTLNGVGLASWTFDDAAQSSFGYWLFPSMTLKSGDVVTVSVDDYNGVAKWSAAKSVSVSGVTVPTNFSAWRSSGLSIQGVGQSSIVDSGEGTFENPQWTGFSVVTTPSVVPSVSVVPTISVVTSGVADVRVVSSPNTDSVLYVLAWTVSFGLFFVGGLRAVHS